MSRGQDYQLQSIYEQNRIQQQDQLRIEDAEEDDSFLKSVALPETVSEEQTLPDHSCYHQAINGMEAERRLKKFGGHCYLTRYSKVHKCYVLSVYEHRRHPKPATGHFEIVIENSGDLRIKGKTTSFSNIQSLLQHYENNRIDPDLKSIGRPYTEERYERRKCRVQ